MTGGRTMYGKRENDAGGTGGEDEEVERKRIMEGTVGLRWRRWLESVR